MRKHPPTRVLLAAALALAPAAPAFADATADRQRSHLESFQREFAESPTLGTGAADTFSWAYATIALHRNGTEVARANSVLDDYLSQNQRRYDGVSGDLARIDGYFDLPVLANLALDPTLAPRLTARNKRLINGYLHNFAVNTEAYDQPSLAPGKVDRIFESDNHDLHRRTVGLVTAQLLKDDPLYANAAYVGADTPEDRYAKWTNNVLDYFPRRAGQGQSVEFASPTYQGKYLRSAFLVGDLAEEARVREVARTYTDLLFADAAQETLAGVRGGAKVRSPKNRGFRPGQDRSGNYLYLFTGEPDGDVLPEGRALLEAFGSTTSDYRVPELIRALGADAEARGSFDYVSRRLGEGTRSVVDGDFVYQPGSTPSVLRTSHVTPDYVLGWFTVDEREAAMEISSQNQWMGAITGADPQSRVVVQLPPAAGQEKGNHELQAIGSGNAMIVRKQQLAPADQKLRVYVSEDFTRQAEAGWVFGESGDGKSFFAVRGETPAGAVGYAVSEADFGEAPGGDWIEYDDPDAWVVMEMGRSADHADLEAFKASIRGRSIEWSGTGRRLIYGDRPDAGNLVLYSDLRLPQVGRDVVDLDAPLVYDSPHLRAEAGSENVTVTGLEGSTLNLNFAVDPVAPLKVVRHAAGSSPSATGSPGYRGLVGVEQHTVDGNTGRAAVTLAEAGTLQIDVDGKNGVADRLVVDGELELAGKLKLNLVREAARETRVFTVLEADEITGGFDVVDAAYAGEDLFWQVDRLAETGRVALVVGTGIDLGDRDGGSYDAASDSVTADTAWRERFDGFDLGDFDQPGTNLTRLGTFNLGITDPTLLGGARLEIRLAGLFSGSDNDALILESPDNGRALSSLERGLNDSGEEVLIYDFDGDDLELLRDGKLNIAIRDDTAVDWVRLSWMESIRIDAVLTGDYNGSGTVDDADADLARSFLGLRAEDVGSAWVSDRPQGLVGQTQLDAVQRNLGNTAAGIPVPEPASAAVLAGLSLLLTRRRRETR